MTSRAKYPASIIFLLGVYILTLVMGELVHQHASVHRQMHRPTLASHACGDHERHIPIDLVRSCAVCAQSFQRVASLSVSADLFHPLIQTAELPLPVVTGISLSHRSSPESRGPPVA